MKTANVRLSQQQMRLIAQALAASRPEQFVLPMEPFSAMFGKPNYDIVEELDDLTRLFADLPNEMETREGLAMAADCPEVPYDFVD